MAAENYFGDTMTATIETNDASPVSVPVASLKQVMVRLDGEHVELDSADTIFREDVAKTSLRVHVIVGFAAFDTTLIKEWMGGDGAAASSPTDDNSVAKFDITGSVTSSDGTTITATIEDVHFPQVPVFDANESQWIQHNIEGDGRTISLA